MPLGNKKENTVSCFAILPNSATTVWCVYMPLTRTFTVRRMDRLGTKVANGHSAQQLGLIRHQPFCDRLCYLNNTWSRVPGDILDRDCSPCTFSDSLAISWGYVWVKFWHWKKERRAALYDWLKTYTVWQAMHMEFSPGLQQCELKMSASTASKRNHLTTRHRHPIPIQPWLEAICNHTN